MSERLSREEIALRLLEARLRSGQPTGPQDVPSAFALAIKFEEHSDRVGGRPFRSTGSRSKYGTDDDGS
jgi:hypothetical protein